MEVKSPGLTDSFLTGWTRLKGRTKPPLCRLFVQRSEIGVDRQIEVRSDVES